MLIMLIIGFTGTWSWLSWRYCGIRVTDTFDPTQGRYIGREREGERARVKLIVYIICGRVSCAGLSNRTRGNRDSAWVAESMCRSIPHDPVIKSVCFIVFFFFQRSVLLSSVLVLVSSSCCQYTPTFPPTCKPKYLSQRLQELERSGDFRAMITWCIICVMWHHP